MKHAPIKGDGHLTDELREVNRREREPSRRSRFFVAVREMLPVARRPPADDAEHEEDRAGQIAD
jgi:hypothetical protein